MPQRKREAVINGQGKSHMGFPGRKTQRPLNLMDCLWNTLGLQVPVLVPMAAQKSVSDEKEDGFQLLTETNKIPSVSAMVESTQYSFSVSPEDMGHVCHSPLLWTTIKSSHHSNVLRCSNKLTTRLQDKWSSKVNLSLDVCSVHLTLGLPCLTAIPRAVLSLPCCNYSSVCTNHLFQQNRLESDNTNTSSPETAQPLCSSWMPLGVAHPPV